MEVTGERTSGELIGEHTPMLLDDDAEEFAQFLAGKVGWPVAP